MTRHEQNVIEINMPCRRFLLFIRCIYVSETVRFQADRRLPVSGGANPAIIVGCDELHLAPVDFSEHIAYCGQSGLGGVKTFRIHRATQRPRGKLLRTVGDMRERRAADIRPYATKLVEGSGMECRRGHVIADTKRAEPGTHLGGGFHGEGDGEDSSGIPGARSAAVGDAPRDGARFTGACTRHNPHRAVQRRGGFALRIIEACERIILNRTIHTSLLCQPAGPRASLTRMAGWWMVSLLGVAHGDCELAHGGRWEAKS